MLLLAIVLIGLAGAGDRIGEPSDTLRLADAVALARTSNPGLAASRLQAAALKERPGPAGTLPDPSLTFSLMNRPLAGLGTDDPMTMNQVELTQTLPWPGKLGFARERAAHLATAASLSVGEAEVQLLARVKRAYFELAYLDRAIAISARTRGLLRDFFQVSQTRYAVGEGLQQDVLQAQVAVARMTEDLTVMEQERVALAARLNALLGREATAPVGGLELADPTGPPPPLDSLLPRARATRPAVRAAQERVQAAAAGYRAARRELYPDFMVGLAWGQRPQFGDMGSLMLGVTLPIWAGRRQLPMRREMAAMQASEEAMARDLDNETFAMLTERRAEADRAWALSQLYRTSILPQARAAVESALSAYRVGRVDYMTLVESEMTVNRYEIELVRLAATYRQAEAELEALVGGGDEP